MAELKRLYWDAGHGGSDPGAVANGLKESNLAIKVVNYAYTYIDENYECKQYKDISDDSLNTICARANSWGADLFVSVHFNAGGGNGYEALVYDSSNKALGQMFEKYVKAVGQNSRGVKYRSDLAVLRLTNMKAILNEIAFIDNKADIKDWDENTELKKMGIALAKAAADYLNLPKKTKKVVSTKKKYTGTFPKLPLRGYFKRGDSSTQVKYLQRFLNWFGGYKLTVDGVVGSKTITAVEKFQKTTGLAVDGLFGKKALAKAKTVKK